MASFDLSQYQTVDDRLHVFWSKWPNGRIDTEIIHLQKNELGQLVQVIVKTSIYRDITDQVPASVDYAEETLGSNPVNRTSFVENCVTSSIGRGLATLGLSPKGENKRPSVEEMQKVERVTNDNPPPAQDKTASKKSFIYAPDAEATLKQTNAILARCRKVGVERADVRRFMSLMLELPIDEETRITMRMASDLLDMTEQQWFETAVAGGFGGTPQLPGTEK